MICKLAAAAVAALCLTGTAASAAPPAPSSDAAVAQPSARALELSRRMIRAARVMDQFNAMMATMLPQIMDEPMRTIPGFRPEWRAPLIKAAEGASETMMASLMKSAEVAYAQVFTEEEMRKAAEFYESPVGQAMLDKAPKVVPLIAKDLPVRAKAMQADMLARFCTSTPDACRTTAPPSGPTGA